MTNKRLKSNYMRRLQASIAGALMVFVFIFLCFPRFSQKENELPQYRANNIEIVSIPRTRQQVRKLPRPPHPVIPVAADELEVLEEVPLEISPESEVNLSNIPSGPLDAEDLPYLPRQTLEVMPEPCAPDISGEIKVLILVDKNGRVKNYRIIKNTTHSRSCLKNIVAALKNSRWDVVVLPTGKVEYWIKKIYRIGLNK